MIKKNILEDGSVVYTEYGKVIKLKRGEPVKMGRMPDYVWRYIQPQQGRRSLDGAPDIQFSLPSGDMGKVRKKGNYTAPRKRGMQKKIA